VSGAAGEAKDHGKVVRRRGTISWAWFFPIVALGAAAWMYVDHLRSLGPEIEIRFTEAPGVMAGKTQLIFRGVAAGLVTKADLDVHLSQVVVRVRLAKSASGLAVETTDFWIDRPLVSLQGVSGLSSLIEGNSIHARMGSGARRTQFTGLANSPVFDEDEPTVSVRLSAEDSPSLERGAPVTYRGVLVGRVREHTLDEEGRPTLDIDLQAEHGGLLRTSSRFWVVPATRASLGPNGIELDFGGLDSLMQGGVAFDDFGVAGEAVAPGGTLPLLASEDLARACGEPFMINFPTGRGLRAGHTMLMYLGMPVGMVTAVGPAGGQVGVEARLRPDFERLRSAGSTFTLIEPQISLQGVSGLQTLLTGVVIDCQPGSGGEWRTRFTGTIPETAEEVVAESSAGLRVRLVSPGTLVGVGAAVLYRNLQVGVVLVKDLAADGSSVELIVGIEERYALLVRRNSVFWADRGLHGSVGIFDLRIQTSTPIAGSGSVNFATPDSKEAAAAAMSSFILHDKPRREWTRWDPQIPLPR